MYLQRGVNPSGLPGGRQKSKKAYMRGSSEHPNGPLTPEDALDAVSFGKWKERGSWRTRGRLCTDHDGAASYFLSTDGELSAPHEPLPWARGEANGDRRALVRSETCAGLRHGGGTRRCGIAGVARALQRCSGHACMPFLLRSEEVRRVDNTCTQCDPKTSGSLVQYILCCRLKSKLYDQSVCPSNQGLGCCTCVSRSRRPATVLTAGRPPSYGKLGEDGPERSRDKNIGVCRMVTGRVRRRPCKAHHGCMYIYVYRCGVQPAVADTSPLRKPHTG